MTRSISQFRKALIAATLLVGAVGPAGAASPVTVSFHGTLNSDPATTIDGWFQYDKSKPVDTKLGKPVKGQFTFTGNPAYTHYLNYSTTKNGMNGGDMLPATDGDSFVILTNTNSPLLKKFQLTLVDSGISYVIVLNTPDMLSQTALPDGCEFPVLTPLGSKPITSPGYGTLTKTTPGSGGTTLTYSIYVTSCVPPCLTQLSSTLAAGVTESTHTVDKNDDKVTLNNFYINADILPILRAFANLPEHGKPRSDKADPTSKPAKPEPAK